ncbi:hypothetical protein PPO43_08065 [Saprospira sp. CCB-QB6]|uniref:hypothetical protein n=1 Tax=Saprospira sp. CCB-QB6 TaxID=3023936 RepID=UPI00234B236C|nr:hypothetical protein [Saprospira sp. CCB-QB6]WCL83041.1 hypothetical protein PPO43_08065 [Saprospira sp. CCB-QB6]
MKQLFPLSLLLSLLFLGQALIAQDVSGMNYQSFRPSMACEILNLDLPEGAEISVKYARGTRLRIDQVITLGDGASLRVLEFLIKKGRYELKGEEQLQEQVFLVTMAQERSDLVLAKKSCSESFRYDITLPPHIKYVQYNGQTLDLELSASKH